MTMMKNKTLTYRAIAVVVVLLALAGCKISEPYEQPDLQEPTAFYGSNKNSADTTGDSTSIAAINWKSFFCDTVLVKLIDSALANNIDLKIADEYVAIGLAKLKQSKAAFFPSVSAAPFSYRRDYYSEYYNNYNSNRSRRNHSEGNVPKSLYTERLEYQIGVDLSWEVDIWGKLRNQKKASQLAYMQTEEFRKAVQTSLIAEIATTYSNLILLKSQLEVYRRNLSLNDSTLKIVELQYDAGEVTSLAVKQTQSQKLRAQTLIPQLEREYIRQENRLNQLVGRYGEKVNVAELDWTMLDTNQATGMPLNLLGNRPDVASAEYKLQASYAKVGIANAMRYPSISLGTSVGLNSMELDKLLNPVSAGYLLLNGAVIQPLFNKRKLKTNYEIALSEKKIAELEFRDQFLQAMTEVSNAMVAIEKLNQEYELAQERVNAARKSVKDASFLFRSGLANYLEVITAQGEALDSELNLENVKMQIFAANVELYRSLGGGWK